LTVVLLLEIWFDYRKDLVLWARNEHGLRKWIHLILTLGATDISEKSVAFDQKAVRFITIIGIPSAFLLHGYVGFIFGSVKANPWWSSVLIPVVFLFSAIVSGIALVLIIYLLTGLVRRSLEMACLDKLASFLFYALIVDFSLEILDFIHRLYEAEESIKILGTLISTRLFLSLVVLQALTGTVLPLICLAFVSPAFGTRALVRFPDELRRLLYLASATLIQIGIFSTRWNVVIGGQLFSKSLRGLTVYKMELMGLEGFFVSLLLLVVPFVLLYIFVKLLPPWKEDTSTEVAEQAPGD
jgi:Ni/Fe-hydrogenase subunit HybB-like protein